MKKIYRFNEENCHEGEDWNFLFRATEEEVRLLCKLIDSISEEEFEDDENPYYIFDETLTEDEARTLLKYSDCGYMDQWNDVGTLDVSKLPEEVNINTFYKGNIKNFCTGSIINKGELNV